MDPIKNQKFSSNSQQDETVLNFLPPLLHLTREQETSIMVSTLKHIISGSIGGGALRDATLSSSGTEIESNCPMLLAPPVNDTSGPNKINECLGCNFFAASTTAKGEKKRELRQILEGKGVAKVGAHGELSPATGLLWSFTGTLKLHKGLPSPATSPPWRFKKPKPGSHCSTTNWIKDRTTKRMDNLNPNATEMEKKT